MSQHTLRFEVRPKRTEGQLFLWDCLHDSKCKYLAISGPSGVGKTFLSCFWAAKSLLHRKIRKIYLCRSVIPIQDQDLGFRPGTMEEKLEGWLKPMIVNLQLFLPNYEKYYRDGRIEYLSLDDIRGRSLEKSVLLIDEAQNASIAVIKSVTSRVADDSKIILSGDFRQNDLRQDKTHFERFCKKAFERLDNFCWVEMTYKDSVRSKDIQQLYEICEEIEIEDERYM